MSYAFILNFGCAKGGVQSELVLAIYEVGQSFFRGWGVEKDKKMAVVSFSRTVLDVVIPTDVFAAVRATSNSRPSSATQTRSRTWRSASQTARAARRTGRRRRGGTGRRYATFLPLISRFADSVSFDQVAQGVSDVGLAWIYKEKFR